MNDDWQNKQLPMDAPTSPPPIPERSKKLSSSRFTRILWLAAAIIATILFVVMTIAFIKTVRKNHVGARRISEEVHEPITPNLTPKEPSSLFDRIKQFMFQDERSPLIGEKDDRINVLLFGMGGLGHDGPYLTDTIILVSIKPSTQQVAMISIPRDLGIDIPGYGPNKINHANHYGEINKTNHGAVLATQVIQDTFDIAIPYYARIDFDAFQELIDLVGGVTIDVERSFVDVEYPAANNLYQTISFAKGIQTMDGSTALKYARSRHGNNGEAGDFARSIRQQKVILALKEKLLSFETLANPVRLSKIIKTLDSHLTTNMEFDIMLSFLELAKTFETNKIIRLTLDDSANGYLKNGRNNQGAFVLIPKSNDFGNINLAIDKIFEEGEVKIDNTPVQNIPAFTPASIEIQNGTWQAGMASRVRKFIEDKDIPVERVGNTTERPVSQSGIYVLTEIYPEDVIEVLSKSLHIDVKGALPPRETANENTEVLVILGEDFVE